MAQGLIDFARAGQLSIVTPFTLMGAMAPITVAGAITLSHAECLAAITLTQLVQSRRAGLLRHLHLERGHEIRRARLRHADAFPGLAGRRADGADAGPALALGGRVGVEYNDVQAANENQLGLWGCLLAGATVIIHSAGWLEGGLTVSYEKIVTDVEVLNMVAELCAGNKAGADEIGFANALSQVAPSGHFFAAPRRWSATRRSSTSPSSTTTPISAPGPSGARWTRRPVPREVWEAILAQPEAMMTPPDRMAALEDFIATRTKEGGAPPVS
jgi:trimethylamine--corrinoid protein Co-methyltransferase